MTSVTYVSLFVMLDMLWFSFYVPYKGFICKIICGGIYSLQRQFILYMYGYLYVDVCLRVSIHAFLCMCV